MKLFLCAGNEIRAVADLKYITEWELQDWEDSDVDDDGFSYTYGGTWPVRCYEGYKTSDANMRRRLYKQAVATEIEFVCSIACAVGRERPFYVWHISNAAELPPEQRTKLPNPAEGYAELMGTGGPAILLTVNDWELPLILSGKKTALIREFAPKSLVRYDEIDEIDSPKA